jgi:hypothetical protein
VGKALMVVPILSYLKDLSLFPHQRQYPLRPETREVLIPIIRELKKQGILTECSSLYNAPILGIKKGSNKWRLVQDLHLINEAVVPLPPVSQILIQFLLRYSQILLSTLS